MNRCQPCPSILIHDKQTDIIGLTDCPKSSQKFFAAQIISLRSFIHIFISFFDCHEFVLYIVVLQEKNICHPAGRQCHDQDCRENNSHSGSYGSHFFHFIFLSLFCMHTSISRTEKRQSTEALCLLLLYFIVSHHRKTSMIFTGISYSFL